jgi:hypothetical protein
MNINTKRMMLLFAFSLKLLLFCGGNKSGLEDYNLYTEKTNQYLMDGQYIKTNMHFFD